jgi:hypothetical protein
MDNHHGHGEVRRAGGGATGRRHAYRTVVAPVGTATVILEIKPSGLIDRLVERAGGIDYRLPG